MKWHLFTPALVLIVWGASCGGLKESHINEITPASTQCLSQVAQIGVQDGYLQNLCGCQESAGTIATPPATLTCTVSSGATLFFQFLSTKTKHQILSTGSPAFTSSPVNDPQASIPIRIHTVKLDLVGTYEFIDALDNSIRGKIIVQ